MRQRVRWTFDDTQFAVGVIAQAVCALLFVAILLAFLQAIAFKMPGFDPGWYGVGR